MAFFEELTKKAQVLAEVATEKAKVAAEIATEKAKDATDTAKINIEILSEQREMETVSYTHLDVYKRQMYDLAARSRNTVSADLPEYIMEKDIVRAALRTAKKHNVTDKQWEDFIRRITKESD